MKYRIHTVKFLISCAVAAFCFFLAFFFFVSEYLTAGGVFLVLACIYTIPSCQLGGTVTVDASGITAAGLLGRKRFLGWGEIQETGIMGINVLNKHDSRHTGPKYLYFSKKPLTRDARFEAALKWPPSDLIYLRYDQQRLKTVRKYWKAPITLYNTGNLVVAPLIKE